MDIKTAVRIQDTTGSPVKHPFQRAIFVMDHRDTDLLHRVERTVKVLNAITLGLIPHPVTDPSPPELPDLPPEPKPEASEVSADGGAETGEPGNARSVDRRVGASRLSRRKSHAHSQVASALDLYHAAVEERHRLMEEYEEAVAMAQVERLEHRYDQVDISQHSLQVMSTKKLTQTEAEDPNLDLLTACQVR